jgi:hypothetical protein
VIPKVKVVNDNSSPEFFVLVDGIPEKNRVETQMKICLKLLDKDKNLCDKYKCLIVDDNILVNPILRRNMNKKKAMHQELLKQNTENGEKAIALRMLVYKSDLSSLVDRCYGCIQREQKKFTEEIGV